MEFCLRQILKKAFDSVDHNFIFATLNKFGFGKDFIQWIKTSFKNSQSCVMKNGNSMGYFNLERRTRQGDPLFPYLCILYCIYTIKLSCLKSGVEFDMNDILYEFKNLHHF